MSVLYNDIQMDWSINKGYKSYEIYVVTIKISMTE